MMTTSVYRHIPTAGRWLSTLACAAYLLFAHALVSTADDLLPLGESAQFAVAHDSLDSQPPTPMWQYRRVYVPEKNLTVWPIGTAKYLPIESRVFEERVADLNRNYSSAGPTARIDRADYAASLDSDGALRGQGRWEIGTTGTNPAFLQLPLRGIVLRNARWSKPAQQAARLGLWGTTGSKAGQFALEVPSPGTLEFEWFLPSSSRGSRFEFPWAIPRAANVQLTLDLPGDQRPQLDGAVLVDPQPANESTQAISTRRVWKVMHGPLADAVLRIESSDQQQRESNSELSWQEENEYSIEQRGVLLRANCVLSGPIKEQHELVIPLRAGTQLTSAATNGQELPWHVLRGVSSTPDKAVITLPAAQNSDSLHLSLEAWQPISIEQHWRLPLLHPEGIPWRDGRFYVRIGAELELTSMTPIECEQTGATANRIDSPDIDSMSFTSFSQAATLDLVVARRQPDVTVRVGSSIVLADPDVTGKLITEWKVTRSQLHCLSGELMPGWSVDAVETIPTDAMAEWFVDRSDKKRRIEIRLTHGVSPVHNVTVVIMARFQRLNLADPISARTLRMVHWEGAQLAQHLLSFQSSGPYSVDAVEGLPIVPSTLVQAIDRMLLDSTTGERQVIDLANAPDNAGLKLAFKRGQYSVDEDVQVNCTDASVSTSYCLAVQPKSTPIDRILFSTSASLGSDARWTERQSGLPINAERLPFTDSARSPRQKDAELWQLRLPKPTTEPIELIARTKVVRSDAVKVRLLSFPEAAGQRGMVLLRSEGRLAPEIESTSLAAIPVADVAEISARADVRGVPLAAYRFDPALVDDFDRSPSLNLRTPRRGFVAIPAIQNLDVESFIWPDGRTEHCLIFRVQPNGTTEFRLPIPERSKVRGIEVDGTQVDIGSAAANQQLAIPLRPDKQVSQVRILCDCQQKSLSATYTIQPPKLPSDILVLVGSWTIWLPDGYATCAQISNGFESWKRRIFGPLAPGDDATVFNPLELRHWPLAIQHIFGVSRDNQSEPTARFDFSPTFRLATPVVLPGIAGVGSLDVSSPSVAAAAADTRPIAEIGGLAGWTPFRQTFMGGNVPTAVEVKNPATFTAWAAVCLMVSFLMGRRCFPSHRAWVMIVAVFATSALLLPMTVAPLATGLLWGTIFSRLARWPTGDNRLLNLGKRVRKTAITSALSVAIFATAVSHSDAVPTSSDDEHAVDRRQPKTEQVLIPTDSQKRPVSTKYYVRDEFLRDLLDSSSTAEPNRQDWLLTSASYQGQLIEADGQPEYSPGAWTLTFALETKSKNTKIILPMINSDAIWQPTAMLDGVPVPIDWSAEARSCQIQIAEPGQYSLSLYCTPKMEVSADGYGQIDLSVPMMPAAAISIQAPNNLADLQVDKALLSSPKRDSKVIHDGVLVHADHLKVRWTQRVPTSAGSQGLNVSELNWLHIDQRGVELQTKYVVEGGTRRPDFIEIAFDDRWIPIGQSPSSITKSSSSAAGEVQIMHLPLPAEDVDRQEVLVRWRLRDSSPIGNVRLPPIGLKSVPATQRWFAASSDAAFDLSILDTKANPATAKEFMNRWGSALAANSPQFAFANYDPNRVWTIAARPHEVDSVVREVVHMSAGLNKLRVIYQANVSPGTSNRFQFSLNVPANLSIDDVNVTEADRLIPVRWARDSGNRVNVFFSESARSDYRLAISASAPIELGAQLVVPHIFMLPSATASPQLHLYREDDVDLQVAGLNAIDADTAGQPELPPVQWLVRPVGIFHVDESAGRGGHITVKAARPQLHGESLISLKRNGGNWSTTFHAQLVAHNGQVDTLRFHIPENCPGPYEFESNVSATTTVLQHDGRNEEFKIRFANPLSDGGILKLRWHSPLATTNNAAPSVPDVRLPSIFSGQRFISVPRLIDGKTATWSNIGVRAASLPTDLQSATSAADAQYEVVAPQFVVAMRADSLQQSMPRIRLAETTAAVGGQTKQWLLTRVVLIPDGLSTCDIAVPDSQQLVQIELDGRPALVNKVDTNKWRIHLNAPQLPEVISVYTRTDNAPDSAPELRRPIILDNTVTVPVELSLWSLIQPMTSDFRAEGVSSVAAIDFSALRFDRFVGIAESAMPSVMAMTEPDGINWSRPWAKLLHGVESSALQTLNHALPVTSLAQVSRPSEEQIRRASTRLEKWQEETATLPDVDNLTQESHETENAAVDSWASTESSFGDEVKVTHFVIDGDANRLSITDARATMTSGAQKVLVLLALASIVVIAYWISRNAPIVEAIYRWPHFGGVLIGLAYWMLLWPSVIGLLIVLASIWFALRDTWPGRSLRSEASTVLRSTRAS